MITAIVYKSGILRRSWKFKFVGTNGEPFGHQYNDKASAHEAVLTITSPEVGVTLRVENEDGTVHVGRIR